MESSPSTKESLQAGASPDCGTPRSPSILFPAAESIRLDKEAPACFQDLNLHQVVDAMVAGKELYNLKPYFYTPLDSLDSIQYRHEVMRDLESGQLLEQLRRFAQEMSTLRDRSEQASKLSTVYQKQAWFLWLVNFYCRLVEHLTDDLSDAGIQSRGFLTFHECLSEYIDSGAFTALREECAALISELAKVKYCLLVRDLSVTVTKLGTESDYSVQIEKVFERFKQGAVKDHRVRLPEWAHMNYVEEKVIEFVAQLHPEVFQRVADFCRTHENYADEAILRLDREIEFYIAYLDYTAGLKASGLRFCYPELSPDSKEVACRETYDLALASKVVKEQHPVVSNDFYLSGQERIFVVSGPNQGGKTTLARTFGQLHFLARLGCPVPGSEARLFLSDQILTHFEREEAIDNLRGKLQDDLVRIHDILTRATPNSIVILNEIFTSTTIQDATWLSKKVLEQIVGLDCLGVWVTFIDELSASSAQTVSMVSAVAADDHTVRTFKIDRRAADGLAYALSLAEKYGLDAASLQRRLAI